MPLNVVYSTASPPSALVSPETASFDNTFDPLLSPGGAATEVEKTAASAHASNAGLIVKFDQKLLEQRQGLFVSLTEGPME